MAATAARRKSSPPVRRRPPPAAGQLGLEALAREAGLHPELVRRLVRLGALDPIAGTTAAPLFPRDAAARLARVTRLRRDLGVGYAGAILAGELLTRIDQLEAQLRRYEPRRRLR
jgi:chaperone modulatory protein CbpM